MSRLIFLHNHTAGSDSFRAGLYYDIPDGEFREYLISERIAYPEDEEPPFDKKTEQEILVKETLAANFAYRVSTRQRRSAFDRKKEREEREAAQAALVEARVSRKASTNVERGE